MFILFVCFFFVYLNAKNGYQQGRRGQTNNRLCPDDMAAGFQRGHKKGRQIYLMEVELNQLRNRIESNIHQLDDIAELSKTKEQELINRNTREYRRRELLGEIKELERESESIHHETDEMRFALIRLEEDYQRLQFRNRR